MKILYISDSHMKTKVIEYGLQLAQEYNADKIILDTDIFDEWNKRELIVTKNLLVCYNICSGVQF